MKVGDILKEKGTTVKTIRPNATALDLAEQLRIQRIGAVVVLNDNFAIGGIVTERDLAYSLAIHASKLPTVTVDRLMTRAVVVCSPDDSVSEIIQVMSQRRIRHLPVLNMDRILGIISIGDVLKNRLKEIQMEADVLRDYAIARREN